MSAPVPIIASVRRRLRRVVAWGLLARVLVWGVGGTAAAIVADRLWLLPGPVRAAAAVTLVGWCAWTVWRQGVRPLSRRMPDDELALFIERRQPQLGGRLISRVAGLEVGPLDLVAVDPAALVPGRQAKRWLATASAVVALTAALAWRHPHDARDGLLRLAMPWSDTSWSRRAVLALRPAATVVAADERLALSISRHHPEPGHEAPVTLSWRLGDGRPEQRMLAGLAGTHWDEHLALAPGQWTIGVSGGDAEPVQVGVEVVRRPTLRALVVSATAPRYAGGEEHALPSLAGDLLPGSTVGVLLRFAHDAGRPPVSVSVSGPSGSLPVEDKDSGWWVQWVVREAGELVVDASDRDGIAMRPSARLPVGVLLDRPPIVTLDGPGRSESVTPDAVVTCTLAARDDVAVERLALLAGRLPASASAATPVSATTVFVVAVRTPRLEREVSLAVGRLAAVGERLILSGRAWDGNDVSGPGIGDSAPVATCRASGPIRSAIIEMSRVGSIRRRDPC